MQGRSTETRLHQTLHQRFAKRQRAQPRPLGENLARNLPVGGLNAGIARQHFAIDARVLDANTDAPRYICIGLAVIRI